MRVPVCTPLDRPFTPDKDAADAPEALAEVLVQTPRQASPMQELTHAETFWSFAHLGAGYRVTETLGRDFSSCSTPASVTLVRQRESRCRALSPFRWSRPARVSKPNARLMGFGRSNKEMPEAPVDMAW
jgi:hypothetical protein